MDQIEDEFVDRLLPIDVADRLKFDPKKACRIGEARSSDHAFAEPFPHIVIENVLQRALIAERKTPFPSDTIQSDAVFDVGDAGHHQRQILAADCDDDGSAAVMRCS